MQPGRPIVWLGRSDEDLRAFPGAVQEAIDLALYAAQHGGRANNTKLWKGTRGGTTLEVVEAHRGDAYRAIYTVRFPRAVYVLHVFKKKSKHGIKTPREDIETIERRLRVAEQHYRQHFEREQ
jgi:phage-related protein